MMLWVEIGLGFVFGLVLGFIMGVYKGAYRLTELIVAKDGRLPRELR
jgi:hypothetical protein